jgi:hypothetical protein
MFTAKVSGNSKSATLKIVVALLAVLFLAIPGTGLLSIDLSQASDKGWDDDRDDDRDDDYDNDWRRPRFCSQTAKVVFKACGKELEDDFLIATANCINVSDREERKECEAEAWEEKKEGRELCKEQFEARLEVCGLVGEKRYDPDFDPDNFANPLEIGDEVDPNPYFPLVQGTQWVYEGGGERITVTVTEKIKLIEGVTCVVVNDLVEEDGVLIEDTDDWYAQDKEGNVWYCGEIAKTSRPSRATIPRLPNWWTSRDPGKRVGTAPSRESSY